MIISKQFSKKSELLINFWKPCELTSWNEQGEITQIEGIWIMTFTVDSSCSHRERKIIYAAFKIHYMIHMQPSRGIERNKELDNFIDKLCETIEVREHTLSPTCIHPSPSLFYSPNGMIKEVEAIKNERDQLREEIEDIKKQHQIEINKLRKEFNEKISGLKNEIFILKEKLDMNPKWKKRSNSYYRWTPDTEKEERCKLPRNFDVTKVEIDEYIDEISFSYTYHDDEYQSTHGKEKKPIMNISLYEQLEEEQKIKDEKKRLSNLDIHNVKTWEDMKDYIYSIGDAPRGKHIQKMGRFVIKKHYGSGEFTVEELDQEVRFKNRKTRRAYCKKFMKWGFIDETKIEGIYKIIF